MNHHDNVQISADYDPLDDYLATVRELPGKLGRIAAHQRDSAGSLSRAAAALRSIGALNTKDGAADSRN